MKISLIHRHEGFIAKRANTWMMKKWDPYLGTLIRIALCFTQICRATLILKPKFSSKQLELSQIQLIQAIYIFIYLLIFLFIYLLICGTVRKHLACTYLGKIWDNSINTALIRMDGLWISQLQVSCVVLGKYHYLCHDAGESNFISLKKVVFIEWGKVHQHHNRNMSYSVKGNIAQSAGKFAGLF